MGSTKYASTGWGPALLSFAASAAGAAEQAPPQPYSWAPWHTMPWPWWNATPWPAFGWIVALAFFALMAIVCWLLMRRGGIGCCRQSGTFCRGEVLGRRTGRRASAALDLLDERYVRGEIDEREYAHMKVVLASPASPSLSTRASRPGDA